MPELLEPTGKIEPNLFHWLTAAALVAVGLGSTRKLGNYWVGGRTFTRTKAVFEAFGETFASSMASVVPLAAPGSVVLGLLALAIFAREVTDGPMRDMTEAFATVLVLPSFAILFLLFSVLLIGRPKVVVPPVLRHHRGMLGEPLARLARFLARRWHQ